MCELVALSPVSSVGRPGRFVLAPPSNRRWRLYHALIRLGEAGPGEEIVWPFSSEGAFRLEARLVAEPGEEPCARIEITVVPTIAIELWRSVLLEHRLDCRAWQDDFRAHWPNAPAAFNAERDRQRPLQRELWRTVLEESRTSCTDRQNALRDQWPEGPAAFDLERDRQRHCREVVFAAVVDENRERCYLTSSPLNRVWNAAERPPILQEARCRAINAGFRLDPPTDVAFEQWFSRIRDRAVLDYLDEVQRQPVAVVGLESTSTPESTPLVQPLGNDLKLYCEALSTEGGPGPDLAERVFDSVYRELNLEPEDGDALWEFLDGLPQIRAGPLPFHLCTFGQRRHLGRLAANSPWHAPASECLRIMERLARTTSGACRVKDVARCLHAFAAVRAGNGNAVNPACGNLFGRFLEHLNALRTLGPCWRLVDHFADGGLWPSQQTPLKQFRAFLGQGTWRDHFEGAAPPTLNDYFRAWREKVRASSPDLANPAGARLLLLWMHLRLDEYKSQRDARERVIAPLDAGWWQSELTGQHRDRAAQAVFAVYHTFLELCASPEENQPCPMDVEP